MTVKIKNPQTRMIEPILVGPRPSMVREDFPPPCRVCKLPLLDRAEKCPRCSAGDSWRPCL